MRHENNNAQKTIVLMKCKGCACKSVKINTIVSHFLHSHISQFTIQLSAIVLRADNISGDNQYIMFVNVCLYLHLR